ncbi:MAG: hypothetical protein JWP40_2181 [Blastococcus sp.]|nr:hypothetical protein [Blastococcus sp.]
MKDPDVTERFGPVRGFPVGRVGRLSAVGMPL